MSPSPAFEAFTNTFVLSSGPKADRQVLCEVPEAWAADAARQRRAHQKSRAGCDNCKKRRVKCDEKYPCSSCVKWGEQCHLSKQGRSPRQCRPRSSIRQMPTPTLSSSSRSSGSSVNLRHMKLFHHFETCTRPTLMFTPELWSHALQLSFQVDFLMNAILGVAACHLAYLNPDDKSYLTSASTHLYRSISSFREAISDLDNTPIDAFLATSFLLQCEVWSSADSDASDYNSGGTYDITSDHLFTFASSLKQVFLHTLPQVSKKLGKSVFMPFLQNNPMDRLTAVAQVSESTLQRHQELYSPERPLSLDMLDLSLEYEREESLDIPSRCDAQLVDLKGANGSANDAYNAVISHICLMQSFLPEAEPPVTIGSDSPLLPTLMQYISSFPIKYRGTFHNLLRQKDPHAMLLLYHFYSAARKLLPQDVCWWAYTRAAESELALKRWLVEESARQVNSYHSM